MAKSALGKGLGALISARPSTFEVERPGAAPGTVIEVLQPGYVLHDRLLRPAMVGVAKSGAPHPEDDGTDDAEGDAA